MRFDIITLFPDMLRGPLDASILKRAQQGGAISVFLHDMRAVATDKHKTVDDTPYGGGAGMLLRVDILHAALKQVQELPEVAAIPQDRKTSVLLCPQGQRFNQRVAQSFATDYDQVTLICGHYEGFDERFRAMVDQEISIGDFVLTGGELPALMITDAISRLVPDVINHQSPEEESFSIQDEDGNYLLEYPHYTRPAEYEGMSVPDVLLSGNHAAIAAWRLDMAKQRTHNRSAAS